MSASAPAHDEPLSWFRAWLAEAEASGMANPNAMSLATVDPEGVPSLRTVLLKHADEAGLVFYTNTHSRKGRALAAHPSVALLFFWRTLDRQVRVEGDAEPVSEAEADAYFASRPRGSQVGAWASLQSEVLVGRDELERRVAEVEARFAGVSIPRPPHWSGYRVRPRRWEFWLSGTSRLHVRWSCVRDGEGWAWSQLYP